MLLTARSIGPQDGSNSDSTTDAHERASMARMPRRILIALSALLLAIGAVPFPCLRTPAWSQERLPQERIVLIRDAETETLLHSFATPLFRAAGLDPGLVRILLVRDRAINAFVSSGNRMFLNTGMLQQAGSALEVIG